MTELHVRSESAKRKNDLGKRVQMVPTLLGILILASALATFSLGDNEIRAQIMIFINSESYLTENKIREQEGTDVHIFLQSSLKIVAG